MANILMRAYRSNIIFYSKKFLSLQKNDEILYEKINGKIILTLNRPEKLNTLNLTMVKKLYNYFKVFLIIINIKKMHFLIVNAK